VVRRLWTAGKIDAEIRASRPAGSSTAASCITSDFSGDSFRVKGPSITPRPPRASRWCPLWGTRPRLYRLIGTAADIVFDDAAGDASHARQIVAEIRRLAALMTRFTSSATWSSFSAELAADGRAEGTADELAGYVYTSDATVFTGTPRSWLACSPNGRQAACRLPAAPGGIPAISRRSPGRLVPELQRRGALP